MPRTMLQAWDLTSQMAPRQTLAVRLLTALQRDASAEEMPVHFDETIHDAITAWLNGLMEAELATLQLVRAMLAHMLRNSRHAHLKCLDE